MKCQQCKYNFCWQCLGKYHCNAGCKAAVNEVNGVVVALSSRRAPRCHMLTAGCGACTAAVQGAITSQDGLFHLKYNTPAADALRSAQALEACLRKPTGYIQDCVIDHGQEALASVAVSVAFVRCWRSVMAVSG